MRNGAHYLLDGFQLLFKKGIRHYVVLPLLINTLLYLTLIFIGIHFFNHVVHWVELKIGSWLAWFAWLFWLLFIAAYLITLVYTFTLLANLIGAPFNSYLSARVELYLTGKTQDEASLLAAAKDVPRILWRELRKLFYYCPRALFFLVLFMIPVVNTMASVLWFLFASWSMASQYLDYPLDNHKHPLSTLRSTLAHNRLFSLSFGATITIMNFIPILNFFAMPAAVAGATKAWLDLQHKEGANDHRP